MGFTQGLSGLNAASRNLTTIGNNIANSQTVGYKSGRTEFADMFAGAIGLGVNVADISRTFTGGPLTSTGRDLDLAINGEGFFRLSQGNQVVYSRNGQFHRTKEGNIANAQGALLTGYNVQYFNDPTQSATVNASGNPTEIELPTAGLNARATTEATLLADLNADADAVTVTPFDPTDSDTYNWSSPLAVYDSLGSAHSVNLYFSKTAANTWEVNAQSASASVGTFTLNFTSDGNLPTGYTPATITVPTTNGSTNPISFTLDLEGTTQTAQKFRASSILQDGYASGDLVDIAIQDSGMVRGIYSNGETVNLAQLAMARFASNQGLQPVGDNAWVETGASGQAVLGLAGQGQFGTLRGGALEGSNVELSKQLVKMIIAQRTYQANAQTIKTQSQVMQTAVNMAR